MCACGWTKGHLGAGFQTCRHAAHLGAGDIKGETRVSGVKNLGAAVACYPSKVVLDGPVPFQA